MGCMGFKEKKDPEDKTLDEIETNAVGVEEFDATFESVATPPNKVAGLNNTIIESEDNLLLAIWGLTDVYYLRKMEGEPPSLTITEYKEDGDSAMTDEQVAAIKELAAPYKTAKTAITKFTEAAKAEGTTYKVKNSRVRMPKTKDKKKVAELNGTAHAVNSASFQLKKAIMHKVGTNKGGLKEGLKELAKSLKDSGASPKIEPNMDGLAEGNVDFGVSLGGSGLSNRQTRAWEALTGEEGLLNAIKNCAKDLAGLKDDLEKAQQDIQALPTDPSEIKGKLQESYASDPMGLIMAVKNFGNNIKELGKAKDYPMTTKDTIKEAVENIKSAFA